MWTDLQPILVAIAIGAMIGAERERSHRDVPDHFGGIRTFTVLALAGSLARLVSTSTVAVGLGAAAVLIAAGSWRSMKANHGSTTVLAGLATYLLGSITESRPALATCVAVVLVVLLMSKGRVHHLLKEGVTDVEVADAVKFAIVAFVVLPLLPNRGMGPYQVLNPFRIWLLVVAITGIGWVGYVGVRVLGSRRGLLVSGAAGGFISASAVTAAMGRIARQDPTRSNAAVVGALAASVSTMVQLLLVVSVGSTRVAVRLVLPAVAAAGLLLVAIVLLLRSKGRSDRDGPEAELTAPDGAGADSTVRAFALRPALVLAAVITITVLVSRWSSDHLGRGGVVGTAALAGLADGHAGAVSAAALVLKGEISTATGVWAAAASIGTNTVVKIGLAFVGGGFRFGRTFAVGMLPAALAFGIVLLLTT